MSTIYVPTHQDGREGQSFDSMTGASCWVILQPDCWAWDIRLKSGEPVISGPLGVLKLTRDDRATLDRIESFAQSEFLKDCHAHRTP